MSDPKLHHYVPQFYLRRFCDPSNHLWAWDRDRDRVFVTSPGSVAAEQSFYYAITLAEHGHDPLTMERQFASLEHEVACVTSQWIEWIRNGSLGMHIPIPDPHRTLVSAQALMASRFVLSRRDDFAAVRKFALTIGTEVYARPHGVLDDWRNPTDPPPAARWTPIQ